MWIKFFFRFIENILVVLRIICKQIKRIFSKKLMKFTKYFIFKLQTIVRALNTIKKERFKKCISSKSKDLSWRRHLKTPPKEYTKFVRKLEVLFLKKSEYHCEYTY